MTDKVKRSIQCGDCGETLVTHALPCPKCGSMKANISITIEESVGLREELRGKHKDKFGKTLREFLTRQKLSWFGKEAKEQLIIDQKGNRKYHHVEEKDENGNWKVVHHEDEPLKKKEGEKSI